MVMATRANVSVLAKMVFDVMFLPTTECSEAIVVRPVNHTRCGQVWAKTPGNNSPRWRVVMRSRNSRSSQACLAIREWKWLLQQSASRMPS